MGIIKDGGEALASMIEGEGLLDELAFTLERGGIEVDLEGVAEDLDGVGIRVQRAGHRGDEILILR